MIIKILIGIVIYILLLCIICLFLKGATKLGNEYDESMEAIRFLKNNNDKEEK